MKKLMIVFVSMATWSLTVVSIFGATINEAVSWFIVFGILNHFVISILGSMIILDIPEAEGFSREQYEKVTQDMLKVLPNFGPYGTIALIYKLITAKK